MKLRNYIISALVLAAPQLSVSAKEVQIDKIEAVVNQQVILTSDIKNMKLDLIKRYKDEGKEMPTDQDSIDKQVLDKLISDTLQLQIAERAGLRISDAQLNQTVEEIAKNQNKSLIEMRNELESSGINYKAYIENIRNELTINQIRQAQVRQRINISDHEVEQMINLIQQEGQETTEFNFAHILLKVPEGESDDAKALVIEKAEKLIEEIKAGTNIKELAMSQSEGPKALEGGDWGWRKMDEIPSLFAENFKETDKKGDIIGPFETRLGVHIIQILDKKGASNVMTEEVKSRHILVKPNIILSDEQAKELLTNIRKQILEGTKTFAELAREYSQDPGSAVRGGELGWADPNMYVPEFKEAAQTQAIGKISEPFHTVHGWHILEVMDRRQSDITDQAIKQKAYTTIYRQRFPAEAYAWINELRQEAYIKINNPDYIIEEE